MNACEECMSIDDLPDFSSRNLYLVALGFAFGNKPAVEVVDVVPASKLARYQRRDYEWEVIEAQQLHPNATKANILEAKIRMCAKYGNVKLIGAPTDASHEERVKICGEIASTLIKRDYVNAVYLTGSSALNLDRRDSDLDLIIALEQCPGTLAHYDMEEAAQSHTVAIAVDMFFLQQGDLIRAQEPQYSLAKQAILIASK